MEGWKVGWREGFLANGEEKKREGYEGLSAKRDKHKTKTFMFFCKTARRESV